MYLIKKQIIDSCTAAEERSFQKTVLPAFRKNSSKLVTEFMTYMSLLKRAIEMFIHTLKKYLTKKAALGH